MAGFGSEQKLMAKVGADISDFKAKMKEMSASAESAGTKTAVAMRRIGRMAPLAIVAGIGAAIKAFGDFEDELTYVSTLVDTSRVSMEKFKKEILDIPSYLGDSTEMLKGLYQALSSDIPAEAAVKFTEASAKFAKAGRGDMAQSVKVLSGVLAQYGENIDQAEKYADIMFMTVKRGRIEIAELSTSITAALPVAVKLGIKFEEVAGAVGALTYVFGTAGEAVTALEGLFGALLQNLEGFKKAGIDVAKVIGEGGLAGLLKAMEKATGGNIFALRELVHRKEGLVAATALAGEQFKLFQSITEDNINSSKSMDVALEKMTASFKEELSTAWVEIKKFGIIIGEAFGPASILLIKGIGEAFSWSRDRVKDFFQGFTWVVLKSMELYNRFLLFQKKLMGPGRTAEGGIESKEAWRKRMAEMEKEADLWGRALSELNQDITDDRLGVKKGVEGVVAEIKTMVEAGIEGITSLTEEEKEEREKVLKQFQESYMQATTTIQEFELFKLEEAYKEFARYVTDKIKLDKWYSIEKKKILNELTEYEKYQLEIIDKEVEEYIALIEESFKSLEDINEKYYQATIESAKIAAKESGDSLEVIRIEAKETSRQVYESFDLITEQLQKQVDAGAITIEQYEERIAKAAETMSIEVSNSQGEIASEQAKSVDTMIDKWFDWIGNAMDSSKSFLETITDTFKKMGQAFVIELVKMFAKWLLLGQSMAANPLVAVMTSVLGIPGIAGAATGGVAGGGGGVSNLLGLGRFMPEGMRKAVEGFIGPILGKIPILGDMLADAMIVSGKGLIGTLGPILGAAGIGAFGGGIVAGLLGLSKTGGSIGGGIGAGIGFAIGGPIGALIGGAGGSILGGLFGKKKKAPSKRSIAAGYWQQATEVEDPLQALNISLQAISYDMQDKYVRQAHQLAGTMDLYQKMNDQISEMAADQKITNDEAAAFYNLLKDMNMQWANMGEKAGKLAGYGARSIQSLNDIWERLREVLIEAGELIPTEQGIEVLKGYKEQLLEIRKTIQVIRNTKYEKIRELRWLISDMIAGEPSIETMINRWSVMAQDLIKRFGETTDAETQIAILDQLKDMGKEAYDTISEVIGGLTGELKDLYKTSSATFFSLDDIMRRLSTYPGGTEAYKERLKKDLEAGIGMWKTTSEGSEKELIRTNLLTLLEEYAKTIGVSITGGSNKQLQAIEESISVINTLREEYIDTINKNHGFETVSAEKIKGLLEDQYKILGGQKEAYEKGLIDQIGQAEKSSIEIQNYLKSIGASTDEQTGFAQLLAQILDESAGSLQKKLAESMINLTVNITDLKTRQELLLTEDTRASRLNTIFLGKEIARQQDLFSSLNTTYININEKIITWLSSIRDWLVGIRGVLDNTKTELLTRIDYLSGVSSSSLSYLSAVKGDIIAGIAGLEMWYSAVYDQMIKDQLKAAQDTIIEIGKVYAKIENAATSVDVQNLVKEIWDLGVDIEGLGKTSLGALPANVEAAITRGLQVPIKVEVGIRKPDWWPEGMWPVPSPTPSPPPVIGETPQQKYNRVVAEAQGAQTTLRGQLGGMGEAERWEKAARGVEWLYSTFLGRGPESTEATANWAAAFLRGLDIVSGIQLSGEALSSRMRLFGFQHGGITTGVRPVPALLSERPGLREAVIPLTPSSVRMIRNELGGGLGGKIINLSIEINNEMLDASSANKIDWDRLVRRKIFPVVKDVLVGTGEGLGRRLEVF